MCWSAQTTLFRQAQQILLWTETKLLYLRSVYIPGHVSFGDTLPVEAGAKALRTGTPSTSSGVHMAEV